MSHLDEGQLHALMDGELDEAERKAAEAHLAGCAECRRELAEARAFAAGADALIELVDLPAGTASLTTAPRVAPPRFNWRNVAWAASLVFAVGLGWMARADQFRSPDMESLAQKDAAAPTVAGPLDSSARENKKLEQNERPLPPAAPSLAENATEERRPSPRQEAAGAAPVTAQAPVPTVARERAEQDKPEPAQDAVRALTNPTMQPTDLAAAKGADAPELASKLSGEERAAKQTERPFVDAAAPAPPAAAPAPRESALGRTSAFGAAAAAPTARQDGAAGGFQTTPMEGAVRILGGSIRLVDGMTPIRVQVGPGRLVPGADPGLEIVRVVYYDPPGRELWLDQQRPAEQADDAEVHGQRATTLLPGDTLIAAGPAGSRNLRWIHQTGFRLGLTAFLPADSLRALARRVQ